MNAPPPIIGVSENIKRIKELIKHIEDTGLNVVISGETGVGKELIAQNLYYNSPRRGEPFIKVNCAALPEGLLESELFGYEQGAFTGAQKRKRGKFELANRGVLFLDEIGDMSFPLQSKLLHVLQSGEYSPLGSEKQMQTDVWIISATNHELEQDIKNHAFREDLYYRLNIINIYIDPLRKRPEDIAHLVEYYIDTYRKQYGKENIPKPDPEQILKLQNYHWPGNVRELQNVLKKIMVFENWDEAIAGLELYRPEKIDLNATDKEKAILSEIFSVDRIDFNSMESFSLKKARKEIADRIEKEIISRVLEKTKWNRSKAATILKISYKTLLYKITDLDITMPSSE